MKRRAALWLAIVLTAIAIGAQPAHAGFQVCNQFERRVDVAFGYVDRERGWVAQGWFIMDAGQCKPVHRADLDNRYYYLFARAAGGTMWSGEVPFCIQKKKFLLVQSQYGKNTPDDCAKAGLDYAQFFKVDVGEAKEHTYNLMATNNPGAPGGVPGAQPNQPPVPAPPVQPSYQQAPPQAPVATAPGQPPSYQQPPQAYRPPVAAPPAQQPPYQQAPQPYRPPVATAPGQQPPYQQAPQPYQQVPPPQPYQQQPPPPVATAPPQQPPYQQAPQTYQQVPQPQPYQQQPPQPYRPPVATAPAQQPPYQQAPQPQPPPGQPPAAPGGGTACQRYPNLC